MDKIPLGLAFWRNRVNNPYKTQWQLYTWLITYLIYVCSHSARKPLSVVKNVISPTNSSSGWSPFDKSNYETLLGGLDSAFLFGYAVAMLFFGHVAERLGIIRVLTVTNLFASIFTILFGVGYFWPIHSYWYYLTVQLLCGIAMSATWPSLLGIVSNWSGIKFRGLLTGIWSSNASVGNILGTVIASSFVNTTWGWSFIVPGLVLLFMTIIMSLFLVERPESLGIMMTRYQPIEDEEDEHDQSEQSISLTNLMKIPCILSYGTASFFLKLTSYTLLYWLPVYLLHKSRGSLNAGQAGEMSAFYDVGSVFGLSIGGLITDFLGRRLIVCLILSTLACPSMFLLNFYDHVSYTYSATMLVLIGFFINGCFGLLVTTVSVDLSHDPTVKKLGRSGAAISGFLDGFGSLGAALGPILSGYLSGYSWNYFFYLIISSVGLCMIVCIGPLM